MSVLLPEESWVSLVTHPTSHVTAETGREAGMMWQSQIIPFGATAPHQDTEPPGKQLDKFVTFYSIAV